MLGLVSTSTPGLRRRTWRSLSDIVSAFICGALSRPASSFVVVELEKCSLESPEDEPPY